MLKVLLIFLSASLLFSLLVPVIFATIVFGLKLVVLVILINLFIKGDGLMPIEDLVLENLAYLYPSDRPRLWEANMKTAIREYRRILLEQMPDTDFEDELGQREAMAILLRGADSH